MRYAENGDLLQFLRKNPINYDLSIKIFDQLLNAIEYLHSLGICNRDIKLENILLTKQMIVKLCDFGISTFTSNGILNSNCGSFEYSSPEAINNSSFDGFKADMWSCGIIFYSLFSRKLPYNITDSGINYNNPIDYSLIPLNIQPIIQSLLSLDPLKRPSASELRNNPIFRLKNINIKPSLSLILSDFDFQSDFLKITSKISQILNLPLREIINRINLNNFNREKLLFILYKQKFYLNYSQSLFSFKQNLNISTSPQFRNQKNFPVCSSSLLSSLRKFIIPKKGTMSSAISEDPIIILNEDSLEFEIQYDCFDINGSSLLSLSGSNSIEPLSTKIFQHLTNELIL